MELWRIALYGLAHAMGVFLYVLLIMFAPPFFSDGRPNSQYAHIMPAIMLMLFVASAAITGTLVFGVPAHLYFKGRIREALLYFGATVGWLLVIVLAVSLVLV
jgi:hypothetical protein